jgi:hypothetical protein
VLITLIKWRIESISENTDTGTNTDTEEPGEWLIILPIARTKRDTNGVVFLAFVQHQPVPDTVSLGGLFSLPAAK